MGDDVRGSRTLSMNIRNKRDGWICSKGKKVTLYKNAKIRADWRNEANEWGNIER